MEAHGSPSPSQLRDPLSPRRLWNVFISSRHGQPTDQTIPLQPRIKCGFFSRYTGPQPVTVSAGRPRKVSGVFFVSLYWTVPLSWRPGVPENESMEEEDGNANAHAGQSSSTAPQPPHAAAPYSTLQGPQNLRAQTATRPPHEDEPDHVGETSCMRSFAPHTLMTSYPLISLLPPDITRRFL